jgi:single-strand DNA-binding protein
VCGKLLYREYDDAKGNHRTHHEIDATAVGPDLNRCAADLRRPVRSAVESVVDDAAAAAPAPAEVAA